MNRSPMVLFAAVLGFGGLAWDVVQAQPPSGHKRALLVGINEYQHPKLPALAYAEADVTDLGKRLKSAGYHVTILTGAAAEDLKPIRANIERHLREVLRGCKKGDTVLLAFAGHGVQFEDQADAFFCPLDARPFKTETGTLLSLSKIYDELDKSFAGMKVLLVDACRDDPDAGRGARGVTADSAPRPPQGVAALFSCRAGERAYEHPKLGHGVFFYHVLQGLEGKARDSDGEVTFAGLAAYVSRRVSRDVPDLIKGGAKQSPNLKADYSTEPVLIGPETERVVADKPAPARAPFGSQKAKELQAAWAKHLGRKVEETLDLGGGVKMEVVLIPPGTFLMGAPEGEEGRYAEEEPREVTLTRPFYLGKYAVSRGEFKRFVQDEGYITEAEKDGLGGWGYREKSPQPFLGPQFSQITGQPAKGNKTTYSWKQTGFAQTDAHPVVNVTWNDATAFCGWLARRSKQATRLPSEAEWEYACRAGTTTRFHFGDDGETLAKFANVADGTAREKFGKFNGIVARDGYVFTSPGSAFPPSPFGLYDMHGNVANWCLDWFGPPLAADVTDPVRLDKFGSVSRVVRGGAWTEPARQCRSAYRSWQAPSCRHFMIGFRIAFRLD